MEVKVVTRVLEGDSVDAYVGDGQGEDAGANPDVAWVEHLHTVKRTHGYPPVTEQGRTAFGVHEP